MTKLSAWKKTSVVFALCAASAVAVPAQAFNTLVDFDGADGSYGAAPLVQGTDGNFYGTTENGGSTECQYGCGTIFKITHTGTLTVLHVFHSTDGASPLAGLTLGSDGSFYGTTGVGGVGPCSYGCGSVFRITPGGNLTTLHFFAGYPNDGAVPNGSLVQGLDGNFYGITEYGGYGGYGTVFKVTPNGTVTVLGDFGDDGYYPSGGLLLATDGNFYGTTLYGGYFGGNLCYGNGCGTLYRLTRSGELTTLHNFCDGQNYSCDDGRIPNGVLIQASDGRIYGITSAGGGNDEGTVFRMALGGRLTTVFDFCHQVGCTDGDGPTAGLIQATDGHAYGTTTYGGDPGCGPPYGCGTAFEIAPTGALTTLHTFEAEDGEFINAGLLQATNGDFYGATLLGGNLACNSPKGCGTLFHLSTGLGPFVAFVRNSGKVGQTGGILGQGFTGTTSVSLNGTPAAFTVKSDTFITATVPPGATTGFVTVVTPSGTLTSNVPFRVTQ